MASIPFLILLFPFIRKERWKNLFLVLLIGATFYTYTTLSIQRPRSPAEGVAHVAIKSIKPTAYGVIYQCLLKSFVKDEQIVAKNLPLTLSFPKNRRPPATSEYVVTGRLVEKPKGRYLLEKPKKFYPIDNTSSFAETRYQAKKWMEKKIQSRFSNEEVAAFLSGLVTGIIKSKNLSLEFRRFGLQHILAISGFHFAIVAMILSMLLRFIFPFRWLAYALVFMLTSYFLFLGESPSILRAWCMALIFFIGLATNSTSKALNSLGIALLLVVTADPFSVTQIGFQLSFLITASILLFYPIQEAFLQKIFPRRPLSELAQMDRLNQQGYIAVCFIRSSFALLMAVNITAVPMILWFAHKFPLLSLIYNLFFPLVVSFSLFFLLIGSFLPFVDTLNQWMVKALLGTAANLPTSFDLFVRWPLSTIALIIFLSALFTLGIYEWERRRHEERLSYL